MVAPMSEITWRSIPLVSISCKRRVSRSASLICRSAVIIGFKTPAGLEAWLCRASLNPLARKCSSIAMVRMLIPFPLVAFLHSFKRKLVEVDGVALSQPHQAECSMEVYPCLDQQNRQVAVRFLRGWLKLS